MIFRFNLNVSLDLFNDDDFLYSCINLLHKDCNLYCACMYQFDMYRAMGRAKADKMYKRARSFQARKKRLQNRIDFMLANGDCIFVTLTIARDDYTFKYVRDKVTEFLRQFDFYVANADWGKLNNRLHYHAVIMTEHVDHRSWPLGLINFERVYVSEKSCKKLAKYVAKLTNHAVKESVKGSRCIYSKNFAKLGL